MKRIYVLAAAVVSAVLLIVGLQAGPAPAEVAGGSCTVSKVKFRTSDSVATTAATTFVDVPDMQVNFTVSAPTCLKVEFSADVSLSDRVIIRAWLDGITPGSPAFAILATSPAGPNSRAFNFGFTNVAAGSHTVRIQWHTVGGLALMFERTLFVNYQ